MARPSVRPRILAAAARLLAEAGPAALTTRAIATEAGVTEASVFNNFGGKADLLQTLVAELPQTRAYLAALALEPDSLPEWLQTVFLAALDLFRVLLPLSTAQRHSAPESHAPEPLAHRRLAERLHQHRQAGRLAAACDADSLALLLLGAAVHTAWNEHTRGQGVLATATERELARRVVAGLAC